MKIISWLDVSIFVCALGDFLALFAPVLRQIARYLPHHRSENASETHPKSSHDKFKTVPKRKGCFLLQKATFFSSLLSDSNQRPRDYKSRALAN